MIAFENIRYESPEEGIGICHFDRPAVRNALSEAMIEEIRALLNELSRDEALRALVFTGGDRFFLGGADIRELRARGAVDAFRRINTGLFQELEQFPRPTIAAIEGAGVGGGLEFAMACDLRVCAENARLGQPEVGIGIIPGAGATYRLPRLIGIGRAKDLVYTGRLLEGPEALEIGLVNRIAAAGATLKTAVDLGRQIAGHSALAVRLSKTALNASSEMSVASGIALETTAQAILFEDAEKHERMTRFLDKNKNRDKFKTD